MRPLALSSAFIAVAASSIGQIGSDVTETERRLSSHRVLFNTYDHGKPLTALQPDSRGTVEFTFDAINDYAATSRICFADEPDRNKRSLRDEALEDLAKWVNYSDAIVTVTAEAQRSAFTPRQSFIYSDWDFRVLKVFKNNSSVATPLGNLITVVRSGGTIIRDGVIYIEHDKTFPDFNQGSTYILFLRQLPESHSFAAASGASFLISANTHLSPQRLPGSIEDSSIAQVAQRRRIRDDH